MRSTKAPRSGYICNSCFFIFQCPGGLEQGGSVDTVSRANKAPAGLCLARGGDPPYALPRPHAPAAFATAVFLFQCPVGLEQGGSVDIVSRANKAPVGLCLARGGDPSLRSTKAPRSSCICNSCFFIFQRPWGLEQGGSVDAVSRANKAPAGLCLARGGDPSLRSTKALHRIHRSLSETTTTPAPRLNLCRGSTSYTTVPGCCGRKPWISKQIARRRRRRDVSV